MEGEMKKRILIPRVPLNENLSEEEWNQRKSERLGMCITIPKTIKWSDYEKELKAVEDGTQEMNYKIPTVPKDVHVGDRCYVCHDGYIKGWMKISNIGKRSGFNCTTTGKEWNEGCYVSRTGKFHYLDRPVPMKGFMGYRIIKISDIEGQVNESVYLNTGNTDTSTLLEMAKLNIHESYGSEFPYNAYRIWVQGENSPHKPPHMHIANTQEGWEIKVYINTGELWSVSRYGNRKERDKFTDIINKVKSWFKKPTSMPRRSGTNQEAAMDELEACNTP